MVTKVTRTGEMFPSVFNDFLKPWNAWFDDMGFGREMNVPAVNISETKNSFNVSMAAPGMKKNDFKIDLEGNMLRISAETEEEKEEKDEKFTRKEYNYSSFSRSFTLPDAINKEMIEAKYENGVLKLVLPKSEESKKITAKQIAVK